MKKWFILAAFGAGILAAFPLVEGVRAGAHVIKAATTSIDFTISAADLVSDCGYDLDDFEMVRDPSGACVPFIRERMHLASTRGNIAGAANRNGYGRLCVKELLELPDDELVRIYAGWASRERNMLFTLSADLLMNSVLHAKYRCPLRQRGQA